MRHALIIGGFTESKRLLEPVAEQAVRLGFGDDAEVLTLRKALKMDDERLRRLVGGANVLTHSAGIIAIPDAQKRVAPKELPNDLMVVAGPEPRLVRQLVSSANKKTLDHLFGQTQYSRRDHARIVAGNAAELTAHPFANLSLVPEIGRFSTLKALADGTATSMQLIGNFTMDDDIFFPREDSLENTRLRDGLEQDQWFAMAELPGKHDELLLNPEGVLRGVMQAFQH